MSWKLLAAGAVMARGFAGTARSLQQAAKIGARLSAPSISPRRIALDERRISQGPPLDAAASPSSRHAARAAAAGLRAARRAACERGRGVPWPGAVEGRRQGHDDLPVR